MSNEIQKLSGTESLSISKAFFESGMFTDIKSAQQALVKIMAGQEIGVPPFAAMSGIHIIQGKPTIGAGIIAGRVKASGKYDYKVLQQGDTVCSIDFYQGKEKLGNSTFTIEQAKKAGTKNIDKFPANMLFARAISNGVKWFCPDIFSGPVYTPEEMQDTDYEDLTPPATAEPTKKPIPTLSLTNACKRLESGELKTTDGKEELLDKIVATYSLTEEQLNKITAAWEVGCKAADKKAAQETDMPFTA